MKKEGGGKKKRRRRSSSSSSSSSSRGAVKQILGSFLGEFFDRGELCFSRASEQQQQQQQQQYQTSRSNGEQTEEGSVFSIKLQSKK